MSESKKNHFVFKGEIAELLSEQSSLKARIMCKPGTLILEVPSHVDYKLGDELLITGNFTCEKIENIHNFNTNH